MPPARSDDPTESQLSGRLLPTLIPILILGGLALAHLEVLARGPGYAGPLLVVDHLFDLALAVALAALLLGAGRLFLRRAGLEPESGTESLLYSVAVGAGLWSFLFLALGAAGLFSPAWIAGAVAAGAWAVRDELSRLGALIRGVAFEVRGGADGGWLTGLAAGATAGAAVFLLLHGSAPPGDWDSLMYHLEIPRRWLAEGRIFLPEDSLHAAYTGLIQLLYAPFLAAESPAAAALLNGIFALLLGLAVFEVGRRLLDAETGILSAGVLWATTGLLFVAATARLDTTLAFYLLLGHAAVVSALVEPARARRSLVLGALVLGLAVGVKYHTLAYGACLAPVGLWAVWRGADGAPARVRLLALVAGVAAVAALPWMVKNQLLLGAPFYPFFAERVLPPWLADLYGSAAIPEAVDPRVFGALGAARRPFDLVDLFLAPGRLTVEPEAIHYNMNLLLLALPLGLLHLRNTAVVTLAVPALLYVGGIAVFRPVTNLRYLFPAIAPLTVVASFLAVATLRRFAGPGLRRGILCAVAAATLVPTVRSAVAWTRRAPVLEQATGQVSRQEYLAAGFSFYAGLAGGVNRTVPPDGEVLLLWEARGYYLAPDHLQDNVLTNWALLVPYLEREESCLEETDITHVLVSEAAVDFYVGRGADREVFAWERFRDFSRRCTEVADDGPGYTLYRIVGAPQR